MQATVHADRLRFLGHVLEGYFRWRRDTNKLGYAEFARVVGMAEAIENRRVLDLDDDQFLHVDRAFAHCRGEILPANCQPYGQRLTCGSIVEEEYGTGGSTQQKARRLGFEGPNYGALVGRYRQGLRYSENLIYWQAMPEIEMWEAEIL